MVSFYHEIHLSLIESYGVQANSMSMHSGVNRDTHESWETDLANLFKQWVQFPLGSFQRMTIRFCSCSEPVSLDWILTLCMFSLRPELYDTFFFFFLCLSPEGWYTPLIIWPAWHLPIFNMETAKKFVLVWKDCGKNISHNTLSGLYRGASRVHGQAFSSSPWVLWHHIV